MLHGGQFHVYYSRSKTTHIIATNLPNSKIQELKGEKVIRPEWITDRCDEWDFSVTVYSRILAKINFCYLCLNQYQGWATLALPTVPAVC